jgi:dephospho-CoA kinase
MPVHWKHNRPKPVIGLAGGIGSGKSTIARLLASEGCAIIDSDALSHEAIQSPEIKAALLPWLGDEILNPDGSVNRKAVAHQIFSDPAKTKRLTDLIHPKVDQNREELMARYMADPAIKGIVWDSPLLLEAGLNRECDAVVFIKVPREIRLKRLHESRGWSPQELDKRENLQFSLDKKAQLADYCIDNSGDQASTLRLVQRVLSQLLAPAV